MKNRATAIILAWLLGGFGGHKFYLGQTGKAIVMLIFFWTLIPFIIAFIEFIMLIAMNDAEFNSKFNHQEIPPQLLVLRSHASAILLAGFLGGFGGHKFYLGQTGKAIVMLIFCWTYIPFIIGMIELIYLVVMTDAEFDNKFNQQYVQPQIQAPV